MSGGAGAERAASAGVADEPPSPALDLAAPFDPTRAQEVTRRAIAVGVLVTTDAMILGLTALFLAPSSASPAP